MGPGAGAPVLYSILMMCVVCVVVIMGLFGMVMFVAGFGAAKAFRVGKSIAWKFVPHSSGAGSLADPGVQRCGEACRCEVSAG